MYFGSPGLALILVVSAAPREKIMEGMEDETKKWIPDTSDPHHGVQTLAFGHFPHAPQEPTLE